MLAKLEGRGKIARDLAYRLNSLGDRKGWTQVAIAHTRQRGTLYYRFSFWDSINRQYCLTAPCSILYTEDMGNSLVVEDTLIIVNPFRGITN